MVEGRALTHAPTRNALRGLDAIGVALLCALGLFLAWPIARLLTRALSRRGVTEIVGDERIRGVAWFSLWQATASLVAVFALALPVAAVLARYEFKGRRAVLALASAPFTLPTVVVGAAFLALAPRHLQRSAALIISAHIFFNVGYAVRALVAGWERLDPSTLDAAATLGASPRRVFLTVTLPSLRRSVNEAAAIVFTLCFTSFGVVLMLGGPRRSTVDVEVYRQALDFGRFDRSAALAIAQMALLVPLLLLARGGRARAARRTATRTITRRAATLRDQLSIVAASTAVVAVTIAPLAFLVRRSLRGADGTLGTAAFRALAHETLGSGLVASPMHAVTVSLRTAAMVAVVSVTVAVLLATVLTRSTAPTLVRGLRFLTVMPLATSPVTLGLGVLVAFSRAPLAWRTSWFMIPIVQSVVCLPFVLAIVVPAFGELTTSPRDAAATLGAPPWRVWWTIDLPSRRRAIAAALGTAFAVGLGEFGAASLLARPASETMPVAIARLASRPGALLNAQAAALSVVLAALTATATLLSLADRRSR